MTTQNELGKDKYFANRGVNRHKSPIANIIYHVAVSQLNGEIDPSEYEKYKFKDLGYMVLSWCKSTADRNGNYTMYCHGLITVDELKARIGVKQYAKFCQGKREFHIQRRMNGKNVDKQQP